MKLPKLAEVRKVAVAVVGVVAQVVALGLLHGTALHWAQVVVAAATAVGVYGVPNAPKAAVVAEVAAAVKPADVWWKRLLKKLKLTSGVTVIELCIIATLALVIVLVFFGTVGH